MNLPVIHSTDRESWAAKKCQENVVAIGQHTDLTAKKETEICIKHHTSPIIHQQIYNAISNISICCQPIALIDALC